MQYAKQCMAVLTNSCCAAVVAHVYTAAQDADKTQHCQAHATCHKPWRQSTQGNHETTEVRMQCFVKGGLQLQEHNCCTPQFNESHGTAHVTCTLRSATGGSHAAASGNGRTPAAADKVLYESNIKQTKPCVNHSFNCTPHSNATSFICRGNIQT